MATKKPEPEVVEKAPGLLSTVNAASQAELRAGNHAGHAWLETVLTHMYALKVALGNPAPVDADVEAALAKLTATL